MDLNEILAAVGVILTALASWSGWVVIRRWGKWIHSYLFGPQGHITLWLIAQRELMTKLGEKVDENDKELDTIDKRTIEILETTKQTAAHTAETRDDLRVLVEATRKFAQHHGFEEVARPLQSIAKGLDNQDNGTA